MALLWVGVVAPAFAHDPGLSTASVRLGRDCLEATVTLSTKDAASLVSLDANRDGRLAPDEIAAEERGLLAIGPDALEVILDDRITVLRAVHCHLDGNSNATVQLEVPVKPFSTVRIRSKWLTQLPPGHRQFLSVQDKDDTVLARKLLSIDSDSVMLEVNRADVKRSYVAAACFLLVFLLGASWVARHNGLGKRSSTAGRAVSEIPT